MCSCRVPVVFLSHPNAPLRSLRPGGIPARNVKGERLLLFLGIIDILQSYRLKKKLEHTIKSMVTDGVSVVLVTCAIIYCSGLLRFMPYKCCVVTLSTLIVSSVLRRTSNKKYFCEIDIYFIHALVDFILACRKN